MQISCGRHLSPSGSVPMTTSTVPSVPLEKDSRHSDTGTPEYFMHAFYSYSVVMTGIGPIEGVQVPLPNGGGEVKPKTFDDRAS